MQNIQIPELFFRQFVTFPRAEPYGVVLAAQKIPQSNPYLTQSRKITSFYIPFFLELLVSSPGAEYELPDSFPLFIDIYVSGQLVNSQGVDFTGLPLAEGNTAMYIGIVSADLIHPFEIDQVGVLAIGAHAVFPREQVGGLAELRLWMNAVLNGFEGTTVHTQQGNGSFSYVDTPLAEAA